MYIVALFQRCVCVFFVPFHATCFHLQYALYENAVRKFYDFPLDSLHIDCESNPYVVVFFFILKIKERSKKAEQMQSKMNI